MNKRIGLQLLGYSVLLFALSYVIYQLAPSAGKATLLTGLVGGALCLIWGIRATLGKPGKAWAILTLIPVCYVLLGQVINVWMERDPGQAPSMVVKSLVTLVFVTSMGMLVRIAYAGMFNQPSGAQTNEHQVAPTGRSKQSVRV